MWRRFSQFLRCPLSGEALELVVFKEHEEEVADADVLTAERAGLMVDRDFYRRIEAGLLLARSARFAYPIARGLPVMLPYETAVHRQFQKEFSGELAKFRSQCVFPADDPMPGERAVFRSFSK